MFTSIIKTLAIACKNPITPNFSFPIIKMATTTKLRPFLPIFPLFLCLFSLFIIPSRSSLDSFIYGGCSQIKYTPGSSYESNLNSLLTSLVNSATYASYNKFSVAGSSPQDVINGLYQCRGDLSMPDCATCVTRAVSQFSSVCSQTCGGAVQLQGCFVKYDNTTFIGQEDKTVVMKKCGPSDGSDADAMNHRDSVLESMESAGGLYRVGGAQNMQGVAQCVGDLSVGECQDCLSEAISRLKTECGGALSGDMFLGKCYARYSASGATGGGNGGPTGGGNSGAQPYAARSDHESSHNDSEKTFAIIIGLLAGVALIIILATFMRRTFGENGK